jgi:hypothetical protein
MTYSYSSGLSELAHVPPFEDVTPHVSVQAAWQSRFVPRAVAPYTTVYGADRSAPAQAVQPPLFELDAGLPMSTFPVVTSVQS